MPNQSPKLKTTLQTESCDTDLLSWYQTPVNSPSLGAAAAAGYDAAAASDGEINLALMERRHSEQPVMDAIHHWGQMGAGASLLLTALSRSKCPKMSPVVRSVTF